MGAGARGSFAAGTRGADGRGRRGADLRVHAVLGGPRVRFEYAMRAPDALHVLRGRLPEGVRRDLPRLPHRPTKVSI